jgi:hypothetical protein
LSLPIELEIKDIQNTGRSASYLELHLEIDSEGRLRTKLYNKRDDLKNIIYIAKREIIGSFRFSSKAQYEVFLIGIKEQVGEKRSAVRTQRYADCPPNITNILSIKHSSMLMISVSENFFGSVFLPNKICP